LRGDGVDSCLVTSQCLGDHSLHSLQRHVIQQRLGVTGDHLWYVYIRQPVEKNFQSDRICTQEIYLALELDTVDLASASHLTVRLSRIGFFRMQ
jgi:hypothetical protein